MKEFRKEGKWKNALAETNAFQHKQRIKIYTLRFFIFFSIFFILISVQVENSDGCFGCFIIHLSVFFFFCYLLSSVWVCEYLAESSFSQRKEKIVFYVCLHVTRTRLIVINWIIEIPTFRHLIQIRFFSFRIQRALVLKRKNLEWKKRKNERKKNHRKAKQPNENQSMNQHTKNTRNETNMAVSYQRRCTTPCNPSRLQFHWINYFFIISITSLLVISHSTTATAQVSIYCIYTTFAF